MQSSRCTFSWGWFEWFPVVSEQKNDELQVWYRMVFNQPSLEILGMAITKPHISGDCEALGEGRRPPQRRHHVGPSGQEHPAVSGTRGPHPDLRGHRMPTRQDDWGVLSICLHLDEARVPQGCWLGKIEVTTEVSPFRGQKCTGMYWCINGKLTHQKRSDMVRSKWSTSHFWPFYFPFCANTSLQWKTPQWTVNNQWNWYKWDDPQCCWGFSFSTFHVGRYIWD